MNKNLSFPFQVKRMEDEDDAYFSDVADGDPFRLGHTMEVVGISSEEEPRDGIMARVREVKRRSWVPLADLEVTSKQDPNYWAVREYVVWFANQ